MTLTQPEKNEEINEEIIFAVELFDITFKRQAIEGIETIKTKPKRTNISNMDAKILLNIILLVILTLLIISKIY